MLRVSSLWFRTHVIQTHYLSDLHQLAILIVILYEHIFLWLLFGVPCSYFYLSCGRRVGFGWLPCMVASWRACYQTKIIWPCLPSIGIIYYVHGSHCTCIPHRYFSATLPQPKDITCLGCVCVCVCLFSHLGISYIMSCLIDLKHYSIIVISLFKSWLLPGA